MISGYTIHLYLNRKGLWAARLEYTEDGKQKQDEYEPWGHDGFASDVLSDIGEDVDHRSK